MQKMLDAIIFICSVLSDTSHLQQFIVPTTTRIINHLLHHPILQPTSCHPARSSFPFSTPGCSQLWTKFLISVFSQVLFLKHLHQNDLDAYLKYGFLHVSFTKSVCAWDTGIYIPNKGSNKPLFPKRLDFHCSCCLSQTAPATPRHLKLEFQSL